MRPIATPTSTSLLHGPVDDVDDLPAERLVEASAGGGSYRVVRSVWTFSATEIEAIRSGAPVAIELDVLTDPPPPVRISLLTGPEAVESERDMRHSSGCLRCLVSRSQDRAVAPPRRRRRFGFG